MHTYAEAKRGFQYLPPSLSILLIFLRLILSLDPRLTFQLDWLTSQLLRSVCLHISALVFQVQPCPAWDPPVSTSQNCCSRYSNAQSEIWLHFPELVSRYSHVPLLHGCWGFELSGFWFYRKLCGPLSSLLEPTIEFCRPSSFPLLYRYRNFPKVSQLMVKLGLLFSIAISVLSVSICTLKHKPPELCLLKNLWHIIFSNLSLAT